MNTSSSLATLFCFLSFSPARLANSLTASISGSSSVTGCPKDRVHAICCLDSGASTYSPDFQARYFAAQSRRMNSLIAEADRRTKDIAAGKGPFPDNDQFAIPHGGNPGAGPGGASQLHSLDPQISLRKTQRPQKLIRNDGSIDRQLVTTVSPVELDTLASTMSFNRGTKQLSLRSFLSTQAVRSTNSLDGIDHCSSNNSTICAVGAISVPTLVMGMGGYLFIRDSEEEFDASAAKDKDLVFIEGATHGFTPCANCMNKPRDGFCNRRGIGSRS